MRSNTDRANDALNAVHTYARSLHQLDQPVEDNLTDLLTDLRHLAVREGIDFDHAVFMSELHFEGEDI